MNSFAKQTVGKIAAILWLAVPLPLIAQVLIDPHAIGKAADIARDKDVVWLALVTAIVAVGFSAWLVTKIVNGSNAQTNALIKLAEELTHLRNDIAGKKS